MAESSEPSTRSARPRPGRDIPWHVLAVVTFGLLGWSGVVGLEQGVPALAVPSLIVGAVGVVRALVAVAGLLPIEVDRARRCVARGASLVAAAVALATGFVLAPSGMDRGFVIAVNVVLAAVLAAYTFLAEPVRHATVGPH